MKLINNKVYFAVQDYLMILLGTLLYGFGFNAFILSDETHRVESVVFVP